MQYINFNLFNLRILIINFGAYIFEHYSICIIVSTKYLTSYYFGKNSIFDNN